MSAKVALSIAWQRFARRENTDFVAFVDVMLAEFTELEQLFVRPASNDEIQFTVDDVSFALERPGAVASFRMICARLGVLFGAADHATATLYGGTVSSVVHGRDTELCFKNANNGWLMLRHVGFERQNAMAYYDDLTPCDCFPLEGKLLAVGWLDRAHSFSKGHVSQAAFEKLASLCVNPWEPVSFAGLHRCAFCRFTGGLAPVQVGTQRITVGASNVFIPGDAGVYVAPTMIIHAVDAHEYAPPDEFWSAVEACPPMRSMDFFKAIHRHGLKPRQTTAGS